MKERIIKFLAYLGIGQLKFEKAVGVSRGFVNKIGNNITLKNINKISTAYPELNINWLTTGEGSMLKTEGVNILPAVEPDGLEKNDRMQTLLPVYDASTSTDAMSLFKGNLKVKDYISIPNLPKCDGAMLVYGDQMSPELKPRSIVIYKRVKEIDDIWFGQMYIVAFDYRDDQHIVVKYIHESDKNGYIKLVSVNPKYPPVEIPTDSIKALAEVKASVRYNLWV